jgi:hypothetical protein
VCIQNKNKNDDEEEGTHKDGETGDVQNTEEEKGGDKEEEEGTRRKKRWGLKQA